MFMLHFRQSDFPLTFTDIILQSGGYGDFDYRVLQEKDVVAAYLTKKGIKQTFSFGSRLLNEKFAGTVIKQLQTIDKDLKCKNLSKQLATVPPASLIKKWELIESFSGRLGKIYLFCEQPILAPLEEIVSKPTLDENNMIEILKHPDLADKFGVSTKEKKILCLLNQLGKLKFSIHSNFGHLFDEIYKFASVLAKKYHISLEEALALRSLEIKKILRNNALTVKNLDKRLEGCVFLPQSRGKRWCLFTGDRYLLWKKRLEPANLDKIKGIIACPGKARGRIKLHLSLTKGLKIPKNTVVVSGMTNPQITPYLKMQLLSSPTKAASPATQQ